MYSWYIPSINRFLSPMDSSSWDLIPDHTNIVESAHAGHNASTGSISKVKGTSSRNQRVSTVLFKYWISLSDARTVPTRVSYALLANLQHARNSERPQTNGTVLKSVTERLRNTDKTLIRRLRSVTTTSTSWRSTGALWTSWRLWSTSLYSRARISTIGGRLLKASSNLYPGEILTQSGLWHRRTRSRMIKNARNQIGSSWTNASKLSRTQKNTSHCRIGWKAPERTEIDQLPQDHPLLYILPTYQQYPWTHLCCHLTPPKLQNQNQI